MKKGFSLILLLMITFSLLSINIHADFGPKATADVTVIGIEEEFYFDVLIYYDFDVEPISGDQLDVAMNQYYQDDYPLDILNGYQDQDGYASRTLIYDGGAPAQLTWTNASPDVFHIGYFHAPEQFKIAIVTKDDVLITSNIIERRLFNSTMTYDLSDVDLSYDQEGVGILKENIPYGHMGISLVLRVLITVAIELIILSFVFKYKNKESFVLVLSTNIITQALLTIGMMAGFYFWGSIFGLIGMLVLGEAFVFATEMIIYGIFLREYSRKKAVLYGFVANLVTFILTIITMGFI